MPQIALPAALSPVLATASAYPQLLASRRFVAAIRAGRRFDPRLPLALRGWCLRCATPCDGQLLLEVVLVGFGSWRRGARLLRALAAIASAAIKVALGLDPALIYADGRDLLTFESGPLPPVEPVRGGNPVRVWQGERPGGPSLPPEAPTVPDIPAVPSPAPSSPPRPIGYLTRSVSGIPSTRQPLATSHQKLAAGATRRCG